jgi:WD40 repeat protein
MQGETADGKLYLVDVATLRPAGPPIEWGYPVWQAVWSADSKTILTTNDVSGVVAMWSVPDGRQLLTLPFGGMTAAYSPDGTVLAQGGGDGLLRLADPTTWQPIGEPVLMGAGFITSVSFSPDARILATGSSDGTVRLLDMATRKPLGPPLPGADNTRAFARWVGDNRVFAGFGDGSIFSYDVDPDSWLRRACAVAGRQLSKEEWADALPGRPYEHTC